MIAKNVFCCPDMDAVEKMAKRVAGIRKQGDSIGGIVEIMARGVPRGLGEPVFDKLDADLAKALMSIGAVKGVEIGAGFESAARLGSENNDPITPRALAPTTPAASLQEFQTEMILLSVWPLSRYLRLRLSNRPLTLRVNQELYRLKAVMTFQLFPALTLYVKPW